MKQKDQALGKVMRNILVAALSFVTSSFALAQISSIASDFYVDDQSLRLDWPHLRFHMEQPASRPLAREISIRGDKQSLDLNGVAAGAVIGRVKIESSGFKPVGFTIRLLAKEGDHHWSFQIFPNHPRFAHLQVGNGEIRNGPEGFELRIQGADFLAGRSSEFPIRENASVEFDFEVPLKLPPAGDFSYVASVSYAGSSSVKRTETQRIVVRRELN